MLPNKVWDNGSMKSTPCVSVIIPLHNKEPWIEQCIASVCAQTLTSLEIIVVDDGSSDASAKIVRKLIADDARIQLIQQENAGVSVARNTGLAAAQGAYLAFVDADDWVAPELYQTLVELAKQTDADSARCGQILEQEGAVFSSTRCYSDRVKTVAGSVLYRELFGQVCKPLLSTGNAIYKHSTLVRTAACFDTSMPNLEDVLFNAQFFSHDTTVAFSPCALYHIRVLPGSLSRAPSALRASYRVLVQRIKELQQCSPIAKKYARQFWVYRTVVLITLVRNRIRALIFGRRCILRGNNGTAGLPGLWILGRK